MRMKPYSSQGQVPSSLALLVVIGSLVNPAIAQGGQKPPPAEHTIETHATAIVEPKHIFPTPLGNGKNFHYSEHGTISNHLSEADNDPGDDPFAFFMMDGTQGIVDNTFGQAWTVIGRDKKEFKLKKRAWDAVRRQEPGRVPDDTFKPLQETFRVTCVAGQSAEECKEIFLKGAENTIIKLPNGIGMGPYARVVSFTKVENPQLSKADEEIIKKRSEQILSKRQTVIDSRRDVYDLMADYDFNAIQDSDKKDNKVQFRCDFSNLVKYWDQAVAAPGSGSAAPPAEGSKEKRWWGAIGEWLRKVTEMSTQDKGNLDAGFEENKNLFHFEEHCASKDGKTTLDTSIDLDAYMKMGLAAHYSYLLRGHILPLPNVDEAYAYFSIEPYANMRLTLQGQGTIATTSGDVDIFKMGFPGLSIKGIIRIGPELEIKGRLDASLHIAGKVEAGFEVRFPKAAVAFPRGHKEADETSTTGDGKPALTSPQVIPELEAEISAEGRISLAVTPQLNFGVSILEGKMPGGGDLMRGDVYLGVNNTVDLGISAQAAAGLKTEATAQFCIWADYVPRVFIGAKATFWDNLYSWGGDYDLYSPEEPIQLLERKCLSYGAAARSSRSIPGSDVVSDNNEPNDIPMLSKRAAIGGRSTEMKERKKRSQISKRQSKKKSLFGGYFSCPADNVKHEDPCGPLEGLTKRDLDSQSLFRRQNGFPACDPLPAMFYNCQHFGDYNYRTWGAKSGSYTAGGICENVMNGIVKLAAEEEEEARKAKASGQTPKQKKFSIIGKSAILTYKSDGNLKGGANRYDACGKGKGKDTTRSCANGNRLKWATPKGIKAKLEDMDKASGEALWLSCDEFPFNASEEGGAKAVTKCVSQVQQHFQGQINAKIPRLTYKMGTERKTYTEWANEGKKPRYKLILHNAGDTNIGHVNNPHMDRIIGGINTWGDQSFSIGAGGDGSNGICFVDPVQPARLEQRNLDYNAIAPCTITFRPPPATAAPQPGPAPKSPRISPRAVNGTEPPDFDYNDPATWVIEDLKIDANAKINLNELDGNLDEAIESLVRRMMP